MNMASKDFLAFSTKIPTILVGMSLPDVQL